jgi:hypothetical protein
MTRLRLIVLAVAALVVAFGALAWLSNRQPFPAAPELAAVSLDLPKQAPTSSALSKLLKRRGASGLTDPVLRSAHEAVDRQRWPEDAGQLLRSLSKLRDPDLETFRRALLRPGCLPTTDTIDGAIEVNIWHLRLDLQYLILRAVALARQGEITRAVEELEALQRRLMTLQRSCAHPLWATLIIANALERLLGAWGFMLAVPERDGVELQPRIWPLVRALATRESPLPDALRRKHRFTAGAIKVATDSWPGFDEEATSRIAEQINRRLVWLAELPSSSEALARPTVEERFFDRLNNTPSWRLLLRYNIKGLLSISANVTGPRARITKWNLLRCRAAARHTLWSSTIRARGRTLAAAASPPPGNPITGAPFGAELQRSDLPSPCVHPLEPDRPKGPDGVTPLPPAPRL